MKNCLLKDDGLWIKRIYIFSKIILQEHTASNKQLKCFLKKSTYQVDKQRLVAQQ